MTEMQEGQVHTEVDVCFDESAGETIHGVIPEIEQRYGVKGEIVQLHGPAGGWPVVRFTGEFDKVRALEHAWGYDI